MMNHSLEFVDKFPDHLVDKQQIQRFLGCVNYISGFYQDCSKDRERLNKQLRKNAGPWDDDCTKAVKRIKDKVRNLPTLSLINEDYPKEMYSDASDKG